MSPFPSERRNTERFKSMAFLFLLHPSLFHTLQLLALYDPRPLNYFTMRGAQPPFPTIAWVATRSRVPPSLLQHSSHPSLRNGRYHPSLRDEKHASNLKPNSSQVTQRGDVVSTIIIPSIFRLSFNPIQYTGQYPPESY